jgi:hypothetical protein
VHAGDKALDHVLGAEVEPGDAGDRLRVQEAARVFVFYGHGDSLRRVHHKGTKDTKKTSRKEKASERFAISSSIFLPSLSFFFVIFVALW